MIGIFDADTATVGGATKRFLSAKEKKGLVEFANEEIPKSFVLYERGKETGICFSQLSSAALLGRSEHGMFAEKEQ